MESQYPGLYQNLPGPSSIRLLVLEPSIDEEVACSLIITDELEQAPVYEALFYEWGDSTDPVYIQCNGISIEVGRNLALALQRSRPLPEGHRPSYMPADNADGLNADENAWSGIAVRQCELPFDDRVAPRLMWIDALCINQKDTPEKTQQVIMMR